MIVVLGSGIAGLTAAYCLRGKTEHPIKVLERDPLHGGASRTVAFGDFRYDLGGHRFYTKIPHVQQFLIDLLGDDLITVGRISRIYMNGKFIHYPLAGFDVLRALGPVKSAGIMANYAMTKLRERIAPTPDDTFEQWAVKRFGRKLYEIYFKVYTEKLWGVPCAELSSDFANQRIKGLSFREAVRDAVFKKSDTSTLVKQFIYPRLGFGMIVDRLIEGWTEPDALLCGTPATRIVHSDRRIRRIEGGSGAVAFDVQDCISSIAMDDFVRMMDPAPPQEVLHAAAALRYRDMVLLFATFNAPQVTHDHWVYCSDADCLFSRFHEPKNWSAEMAPPDKTGLVIEFFCQEGDDLWAAESEWLFEQSIAKLREMGIIKEGTEEGFDIQRIRKAYPVYNVGYGRHVDRILGYLRQFENLHSIGRNALFRYTSSDIYIDMGIKAAENILGHNHEIESIGTESEYAEHGKFRPLSK
ncbi:MAG: NAD(P)-binding protein [Planctomycetes bacterium]|nr:NAD(P)-binding protein [Planctomycetota bacterium]